MSIETPKLEPTMSEVVAGIIADFQKLVSQQVALLRAEVSADWQKTTRALQPIVAGGMFVVTGVILLGFTAAFALHWSVSPAVNDPARFPLWVCFGVVAIAFVALGAIFIAVGLRLFQSFNPLPNISAAAFEKNLAVLSDAGRGPVQA